MKKVCEREIELETRNIGRRFIAWTMAMLYMIGMSPSYMYAGEFVRTVMGAEEKKVAEQPSDIPDYAKLEFKTVVPAEKYEAEKPLVQAESKSLITRDKGGVITLGKVSIEIPAGAVKEDTQISISRLGLVNETGETLKNVTENEGGYRFLPAGTKFDKEVVVSIPYGKALNLTDQEKDEMYTYFYDVETKAWVKLDRKEIDEENGIVKSYTTHFTDMINATLTMPETAGQVDFNINSLKNLEGAKPDGHVLKLNSPKASNMGDGSFSFELPIPAGRNGLQPSLTISYSSGGSSGILGKGFDVNYGSTISIDTRKRLPKYNVKSARERDPVMKDGVLLKAIDEKTGYILYEPEKQVSYDRIERFYDENQKKDYFLVTDKKGTKTYYGDYPENESENNDKKKAYVGENGIKKFVWYPTEVVDTGKNRISFLYENDSNYTYPSEIQYSFGKFNNYYFVKFIYDKKYDDEKRSYLDYKRKDVRVDARSGQVTECKKILTHIQVGYSGKASRTYEFIYNEGIAKENYVTELKVWNDDCFKNRSAKKTESYSYYFDYYGLDKDEFGYNMFDDEVVNISTRIPVSKSSNSTSGSSVNASGGVGFGTKAIDGRGTGGVSGGSSSGTNYTNNTIADMNGDGIPDLVAQSGPYLKIYRGLPNGKGFNSQSNDVLVNTLLDRESSSSSSVTTNGYGGAGAASVFAAGYTGATTSQSGTSESTTGLIDVDGDGRPDIITGNGKYLRNESNGNLINFTEHNIIAPSIISTYSLTPERKAEYSKSYSMQRPFRAWRSRLNGKVEVSDTISGKNVTGKIYKGNSHNPSTEKEFDVNSGEYLYFVPDPQDVKNDMDCEWNINLKYKTVRPYVQRTEVPFVFCPPMTLTASGSFYSGSLDKDYKVDYGLKNLYSKPVYTGSGGSLSFSGVPVNLLSDWKSRLTDEDRKSLYENDFFIPQIITDLPKNLNSENKNAYELLYGMYKYDYTCRVFRLIEDAKDLDLAKLWQVKKLLEGLEFISVKKALSVNSLDAVVYFENSKTKTFYGKNMEENVVSRKKYVTGFLGTNEIEEGEGDEKKKWEEHEIVLKDTFDKVTFKKIVDEDGKIKVDLSGNDKYKVTKAIKNDNGDIAIRIEDIDGLYEINQILTGLTYVIPEMSDYEMTRLYNQFAQNMTLEDIAEDVLAYAKSLRASGKNESEGISQNELDSWKRNSIYAKKLDSDKLDNLCNGIFEYDSKDNVYKKNIKNTGDFKEEIELYKNYRFHNVQFPFYECKNSEWLLKEEYKVETVENSTSRNLIISYNKFMGYGLYTKLSSSLRYKNEGEYEINNGKYKLLSLNEGEEKWVVNEIPVGKVTFDTDNDYNPEDFVSEFKGNYWKDEDELTLYCEETLYGGNAGWYYGIWQGTETEHPFNETNLLHYDDSDVPNVGKDFNSGEYAKKCEADVKSGNRKTYEFSYYLPSKNGENIKIDAAKNTSVLPDALIGVVSNAIRRNEEDVDGAIVTNEKEVKFTPFIYKNSISCKRLGGDSYYGIEGIMPNVSSDEFIIRKSRNSSTEKSEGPTVSLIVASVGSSSSISNGSSEMERSLQDVTGDRIPDIVLAGGLVYEGYITDDGDLKFYPLDRVDGISKLMESCNTSSGRGVTLDPSGCVQAIMSASGKLKGVSLSTSTGSSDSTGSNEQKTGFIDINGDGISDYIEGGVLKLGKGKSFQNYSGFVGRSPLQSSTFNARGSSLGIGVGGESSSVNGKTQEEIKTIKSKIQEKLKKPLDPYEYSQKISCSPSINIGGGSTVSTTTAKTLYSDINGDGLVDIVNYENNVMSVRFNTGNGFADAAAIKLPEWIHDGKHLNVVNNIDSSTTTTVSFNGGLGVSVNISIPLPPFFVTVLNITVAVGGSGNSSTSITLAEQKLMDIDGDGLVDHVFSLANGDVYYKRNISGMNGILNKIITPQGGIIEMEYEGKYGTVDMPQFKYLLKKVTVHDGNGITVPERSVKENGIILDDVHQYVTEYNYTGPKYDRDRKEFFGFADMTTKNQDGTYKEDKYHVDFNMRHLKGAMISSKVSSGGNDIYTDIDINGGNNNNYTMSETYYSYADTGNCALVLEEKATVHERNGNTYIENTTCYDYDEYGNVIRILETTNDDSVKPLCALINYSQKDLDLYIVGNPTSIRVYDHEVEIKTTETDYLRKREGHYHSNGWLDRLSQFYEKDSSLVSEIEYYDNGTIKSVSNPDGTSMFYEYDDKLGQFPKNIRFIGKNKLSYDSFVEYDVETQTKGSETDANGKMLKYEYDQWQRVVKISSPYDNGVGAIEYEYGTFDTSFIKEKVQVHPFWYARTKNKVGFNDDRTIDTLVQIDGLGQVFKTAKTGCVYNPEMKRSIDGWNVSGASVKDDKGRTVKNGQPYFEEHFSLDSIDTIDLLMNYGTETKYDEKDRAVRVKVPFDLDKSSDSERYSITRTNYSIYDKKLTTESIDAKGNATETICDAKGNIISISKYGFDTGNKKLAHTTYKYNAMGEMTESYDCEGNEIKVEYDILGRKTALESRDSGRYIYEYNGEGKLQYESNSRLIAEGKRIGYFYDSFGRLSKIDYPDTKETVYEYGSPDTSEENAKGRLVRVSDSSGVMEYVYGDLGEIKEEKRTLSQKHNATLPDMTAVTKFESNYLGQMESITYPDNEVVAYAYDDAGQVVSVMGKNDHDTFIYVDMIGYDEFGQRIYIKYGNGVETNYEYKKETRLLESIRTENESRQLLQNIKYSFDAVGNIEGYVNNCKGMGNYETRQSYKYDNLYQLTGVNGFTDFNRYNISGTSTFRSNYSQTYEFDSIGNMKLKKSEEVIRTGTKTGDDLNYELNYVKDPLYAHRFISIGDRYYKYDEIGNVIGEQTGPYSEDQEESELIKSYGDSIYGVETAWGFYEDDEEANIRRAKKYHREYQWDERNQLIRSKDNNAEVMFVYGQDGKRSNKYTIDTETLYFNNFWSYYIDPSVNSCGGKVSKHIFLGETRLATSINSYNNVGTGYHGEEKDHIYFYHSDHLGSAQLVTDWQGYEYQRIEYTPYGESWVDIKIMGAASVMPLSYKFSAKERDEETGLYYYGARYLDPKYSRWLSTDPALGDYIPGAGKGNTKDSGNLPGMGGIFNHINGNLYHYAGNNPVKYVDPDGRVWLCRNVDGVDEVFYKGEITTNDQAKAAYGKSAYVFDDGHQFNGYSFYNGNGSPYMTDSSGNKVEGCLPIQGKGYDIFPGSATQTGVNPDTLHKNLFGTSYTGPNNPTDYASPPNPNFDYIPHNRSEFGSIMHDLAYGEKGAAGVKGALFNRDVAGADFKLAGYNFCNMFNPSVDMKDRLRSYATFEAFMLLGIIKTGFIPNGNSDPMTVGGIYARH